VQLCVEWSGKGSDIFETAQRSCNIADEFGYTGFRYDEDGLGAGIRGDMRQINERRKSLGARIHPVEGWRGSAAVLDPDGIVEGTQGIDAGDRGRTNKDFFANRKAQGWWGLRRRVQRTHMWVTRGIKCDPDQIISIDPALPHLWKLIAELCQPTYKTNEAGKMVINKQPEGMPSPNMADGVMMRFAPGEPHVIVTQQLLTLAGQMPRRRRH
jgi:phage terminase large subunit